MALIRLLTQEFVCEDSSYLFRECHAATCLKNESGDLLVAYFGGTKEKAWDVGIWLSRKIGGQWEEPRRIKYIYALPHWNPVLHADGDRILLYYKVGPNPDEWYTMVSESYDFGETWSVSREAIPDDHSSRIVTKNKLLVARDGRWFGGTSREAHKLWDCAVEISEDSGKSWTLHPIPYRHRSEWGMKRRADGIIQPALWQSGERTFHCLMRSSEGYIYRSDSADNGETWCEAYPTGLPNNNSGITLVQMPDGALVLVYNPVGTDWGARTPLSCVISWDNGASWSEERFDFETEKGEFSYPYAIADGRTVELVYTWNRRKIVHCTFEVL